MDNRLSYNLPYIKVEFKYEKESKYRNIISEEEVIEYNENFYSRYKSDIIIKTNKSECVVDNKFFFEKDNTYTFTIFFKKQPTTLKGIFYTNEGLRAVLDVSMNLLPIFSMESSFEECVNLENIEGLSHLNVAHVRTFNSCFCKCYKLCDISPINNWVNDVATDFSFMFYHCNILDQSSILKLIQNLNNNINSDNIFETSDEYSDTERSAE